jgi:two-component system sensor histidine kinase KdpD
LPLAISARTGQEFWFENGAAFDQAFPRIEREVGLRRVSEAVGVVPIRAHRGEILGALVLAWSQPRTITKDSQDLFRTVAGLAAAAIERANLHEQLAERVRELTLRSEAREAYLAVLSHELRTPVTTIFGTAVVLKATPDRPDAGALIDDIADEAQRLERIVEDLLVLSRVERGTLDIEAEPVLLQRIIPGVIHDVGRRFADATFELDLPGEVPAVIADATALRQILTNLATNAAKYARRAGPICIRVVDHGDDVGIQVEDRGPGLGLDPDALFGLFVRAEHTAKLAAGTGIGLYVVRQLTEAMGGLISAANREDGGSVFEVRLPSARVVPEPSAADWS